MDFEEPEDDYQEYVPVKVRKQQLLGRAVKRTLTEAEKTQIEEESRTLVDIAKDLRKLQPELTEEEQKRIEEQKLLEHAIQERGVLAGVKQRALDIKFEGPVETGWTVPQRFRLLSAEQLEKLRTKYVFDLYSEFIADVSRSVFVAFLIRYRVGVSGEDIPPIVTGFKYMKLPKCILDSLESKNIQKPTPIQMQGLPVIFSGRDMIGIASTGSGKTMVFSLPMVLLSLRREFQSQLRRGEGPRALMLCPSRELASQTGQILESLCSALIKEFPQHPLRVMLSIGGIPMSEQSAMMRNGAVHLVVATPGRLLDLLNKQIIQLDHCTFLALDEADRLIEQGFEDDMRRVLDHFKQRRQTVLFSATMPRKIQEFALSALSQPVVVNVGRAGSTSKNITQHVEYVEMEARLPKLLECLQKTAPPVLIFGSHQGDVDMIHEYLLLKGVNSIALHGGKSQQERLSAIDQFKSGERDVLVATDVASKGLDFPQIEHVINFDLPKDIEDYVHRIGRTGRGNARGLASSFITRDCHESLLLDLKYLLLEAKQHVPSVLLTIHDPRAAHAASGAIIQPCGYCGGPGHSIAECSKFRHDNARHRIGDDRN